METLTPNFHLKYSPSATVILNKDLRVLDFSEIFQINFSLTASKVEGQAFNEIVKEIPIKLIEDIEIALKGKKIDNPGHKFFVKGNKPKWLKWSIRPWKTNQNEMGGLVLNLENVSASMREQELLLKAEKVSKTGSWELNLVTNEIYWSPMTKLMHEVPMDFKPVLEEGLNFYKEGASRENISLAVNKAIVEGIAYDEELILITAKGKELWVRAKGEPEFLDGQCVRLFGTIQDIDKDKKAELKYLETSERLKIATKTANIGVFQLEVPENRLIWDDNMYKLHGVTKGEIPITYDFWASTVHPNDLEDVTNEFQLALSGEKEFDHDFRILCPDNSIKHVKGLLSITKRGEGGEPLQVIGANWDITELKTVQSDLTKSELSLTGTFQHSANGMAFVDLSGKWTKVNDSFCKILGYSREELLNLSYKDITHPDDLDLDIKLHQDLVENKRESYQLQKRYLHKNGSLVHVILVVTAIKGEDNKVSHFISQVLDITLRINSESKFRTAMERLDIATKAAHIGIWELYLEDNMVVCNDNMYDIYGISKDSSNILEDWMQRIHPEDREDVQKELESTINTLSPFNLQFRAVKPNNEIVHVIAKAEAQTNAKGEVVRVIGSNWDTTELKQTKLKLERNKESFMETFQNSAAGMALVSPTGNWLKVNNRICESLGYSENELLHLTFQDITHPEDLDKDLDLLQETIEGKRDSYQIEKRYFHKNGDLVYAILTVTIVRKIDGSISHFVSQVLDITSIKEAEKRLNTLVEVTKGQNESLMNFAHIVSHNLRSHSTNMTMLVKFLSEEKDPKEQENLVGMLFNASEGLSETIHHLNEVVQVKTGALEKMQSISILSKLKNIEKSIEALLLEKNAITQIDVDQSHFITGVPAYIESIFFNLYTNSLKYSSTERTPVIKIKSEVKKEVTEITFSDNGQGIDLKRHGDKIFGMYKTFHKNKDAKGIGLFITKNQIESMGGSIRVESSINKGTTFIITLKTA